MTPQFWFQLLGFTMKAVGFILDKSKASDEIKKKFLDLGDLMKDTNLMSAKIKLARDSRLERLKKKVEEENQPNKPTT